MNVMPKMMKPFMTQFSSNFKSALFCLHSSAYSSGVQISCYFANSEPQRCFGCSPSGWMLAEHPSRVVTLLTVVYLLYWSDWIYAPGGRHVQIETKTKFRFGNIAQKQWTLSGFVQHTSANSMYKISRQQKYCIWIKSLNVCHIFKRVLA